MTIDKFNIKTLFLCYFMIISKQTNTYNKFSGECGKNNNSNPCEHICLDLHDGTYECSCFYGFTLAVDGYSCAKLATTTTTISSISVAEINLAPSGPTSKSSNNNNKSTLDYYQLDDNYYEQSQQGNKQVAMVVDNHNSLGKEHNQQISNNGNRLGGDVVYTKTTSKTIPGSANDNRKSAEELARGERPVKEIYAAKTTLSFDDKIAKENEQQQPQRTFVKEARFNTKNKQSLKGIPGIVEEKMSADKRHSPIDKSSATNLILMQSPIPNSSTNNNNNNNHDSKEGNNKGKLNEMKVLFFM